MSAISPDMKQKEEQSILVHSGSARLVIHGSRRATDAVSRLCLSLICGLVVVLALSDELEAKTPTEVFKQASKSILVIKTYDANGKLLSSGSGVALDKVGDVVTNFHVIERSVKVIVIYDNREYPASPKYVDRIRDICSLSVPGLKAFPASPGKTSEIEIGSTVYAIGFPMAVGLTFSNGMVSCLKETSGGHYIQFTAPISPGSSGGGLFDEEARLIGIPTYFVAQGQLLNFALPVEWVYDLPKRHVAQSAAGQDSNSDDDFRKQMVALEESEDWLAQIKLCERWAKEFPGSVRAWELLGSAYVNNGEFDKAIDAYRNAVKINPDSSQYWVELALLYGRTGQRDKEIESYRIAVRNNPEFAGAWYKLAIVYRDAAQFDNALEASQQVIRISPGNISAWMLTGYSYGKLGKQDKAIDSYLQAILYDHYSSDAYVCLGIAYNNARREREEAEAYQQALRIKPDESAALFNLGHYYLGHGDKEKAMDYYSRLKNVDPELAKIFFNDLSYRVFPATARQG
jgi:tetratricopeptide (TPR) repeat protein